MQVNWELINKNLKEFQINYKVVQNFVNPFINPLLDLILEEYQEYGKSIDIRKSIIDENYVSLEDSIEVVEEFFKDFDMGLYQKFQELLQDKNQVKIALDNKMESRVFNNILYLFLKQNGDDKYTICHEFTHKFFPYIHNYDDTISTLSRQMVVEINSLTMEKLFNDKEKNNLFLKNRLISDFNKTISYSFIDWMSQIIKKYGMIDGNIFVKEFNNLENDNKRMGFYTYLNTLAALIQNNNMAFQNEAFRYIIGSTLSSTLFYRLKNETISVEEYIKMMSDLTLVNTYEEALDRMNLNYIKNPKILDEIKDSYKKHNKYIFTERDDTKCKK